MKVRGAGRRASVVFRLLWWVASCGLKWTLRCRRVLNVTTGKEPESGNRACWTSSLQSRRRRWEQLSAVVVQWR